MKSFQETIIPTLQLSQHFDSILMLTWSNWNTEMRSNRYHYATRFANHLPVVFVQPFLKKEETFYFESTQIEGIRILHITQEYGPRQTQLLKEALAQLGFKRPLLWIYNFNFIHYILDSPSPLKIYHATEDYFSPDFSHINRESLITVLANVHLLVSVSPGVRQSYIENGSFSNQDILLPNGCDYTFWAPSPQELEKNTQSFNPQTVFYQGNINRRIDFQLLHSIMSSLPHWEFRFCGIVNQSFNEWNHLLKQNPNLKFYGRLTPPEMKELAYTCSVAIIPFVQSPMITTKYLPLKSFEYLAAGLPVVSVPIDALKAYPHVFSLASTPSEFVKALESSNSIRHDIHLMKERLSVAKLQDYHIRFQNLLLKIQQILSLNNSPNME